jgi:hypothetical protein
MAEQVKISASSGPSAHRKGARVQVSEKIFFSITQNDTHGGLVQNLSQSGAFMIANVPLPPMTPVRLTLTLSIGAKRKLCSVSARIVRRELVKSFGLYGYGIRFDGAQVQSIQTLIDYILYKTTGKLPEKLEPANPGLQIPVRFVQRKT